MQKNWIGKCVGCEIDFQIGGLDKVKIFTTRPDTIFGASFIAVSVDHEICNHLKNNSDFEKFKNHSNNPNISYEGVATRDIAKGEELTYDYGFGFDEDYKDFPCRCGSKNCVGFIVREGSRWRIKKRR